MRIFTISAALAALLGGTIAAQADGMYGQASYKDAAVVAPFSWTGLYIGGHIGGLFDEGGTHADVYKDSNHKYIDYDYFSKSGDESEQLIAGVHVGYNVQDGHVVYGLEADVSFADDVDYLASVRGRLGVSRGEWLVYATAGVAFVGYDYDHSIYKKYNKESYDLGGNVDETGFVVGAGFEKMVRSDLSFGIEGLYYSFDDDDISGKVYENSYDADYVKGEHESEFFVVRARITYHTSRAVEHLEPLK